LLYLALLINYAVLAQEIDTVRIGEYTFVGKVVNGQVHGYGKQYHKGKLDYEGDFKDGFPHGEGTYYYGPMTQEGRWEDGEFKEGKMTVDSRGLEYEGIWEKGDLIDGTITYDQNIKIKASTRKLKPHGEGVMISPDKTRIKGIWKYGSPVGTAMIYYPHNSVKTGKWKKTKHNEIVLFITYNGVREKARYANGDVIRIVKERRQKRRN